MAGWYATESVGFILLSERTIIYLYSRPYTNKQQIYQNKNEKKWNDETV